MIANLSTDKPGLGAKIEGPIKGFAEGGAPPDPQFRLAEWPIAA
jgi:hypothetical protein